MLFCQPTTLLLQAAWASRVRYPPPPTTTTTHHHRLLYVLTHRPQPLLPPPALYHNSFECFNSFEFALPSFSFEIFDLNLDLSILWDWPIFDPSDLLEAAKDFTAVSFAGALVKVGAALGNVGLPWLLSLLGCYDDAGGKNVPLGGSAQGAEGAAVVLQNNYDDVSEGGGLRKFFESNYGKESFIMGSDGNIEIRIDGEKYGDTFEASLADFALIETLSKLEVPGCKLVTGRTHTS